MAQQVVFEDLGRMSYKSAWDLQENVLGEMVSIKTRNRSESLSGSALQEIPVHRLYFVEHPPVYTLGKSGKMEHVLLTEEELKEKNIEFFKINRGGDITFHGPGQLVGYPIFDLEQFYTDIGLYLRNIEEVIIRVLDHYGLKGERSAGETGVWMDPDLKGRERKICAIGVRCSRWVTMHGFAFNVNTDLSYFSHIIPCGIQQKQVTSLSKELGRTVNENEVKQVTLEKFSEVFDIEIISASSKIPLE